MLNARPRRMWLWLYALVALSCIVSPGTPRAWGEGANPLERDGTRPAAGNAAGVDGGGGIPNPLTAGGGRVNALPPITVPDFITPGARLIYTSSMTTPPKQGDGGAIGTTSSGVQAFDVVAVLPDRVLVHIATFVPGLNDPQEFTIAGGSGATVTAHDVHVGGTLWLDKQDLAAMQPAENILVSRGDFPLNGETYQATIITTHTNDSTAMNIYDSGTGLLLAMASGVGKFRQGAQNSGLNREIQNSQQFQTYRKLDIPWQGGKNPAWVRELDTMVYDATMRMAVAPDIAQRYEYRAQVTERGEDWAIGTGTSKIEGQPESKSAWVTGPGAGGGLWLDPEQLRQVQPGVIDRDPYLGMTVTYEVKDGPMGRAGVITQTSRRGTSVAKSAYSLQDGALVYASITNTDPDMIIELTLRERTRKGE